MKENFVNIDEYKDSPFCCYYETNSLSLYPGHMHSTYELSMITEGDLMLKSNNVKVLAESPAIIMHKPFTFHRGNTTAETRRYKRYVLNFRPNLLSEFAAFGVDVKKAEAHSICVIRLGNEERDELAGLFEELIHTDKARTAKRELYVGLLLECFIRLLGNEENVSAEVVKNPYINDVLRYITENFSRKITIDELASLCYISRAKLTADFRHEMDMSIGKYIELVRISEAMRCIVQDKRSLSEAAYSCGFCSESRFIEVYRKNFGITPGEHLKYMA